MRGYTLRRSPDRQALEEARQALARLYAASAPYVQGDRGGARPRQELKEAREQAAAVLEEAK